MGGNVTAGQAELSVCMARQKVAVMCSARGEIAMRRPHLLAWRLTGGCW